MKKIEQVSIVGMGALGILYGAHIAKKIGFEHVHYVMDEKRCEKYKGAPVFCNGEELHFSYSHLCQYHI